MPTDRYTKFIFTLIAISLTVIALRPYFSPTSAGAADMNGCGHNAQSMLCCWVGVRTEPSR
jgi:hypothetical protein